MTKRKAMKMSIVPVLLGMFLVTAPAERGSPPAGDEARSILGRAVDAVGGIEKATSWTTRVDSGLLVAYRPGWGKLRAICTRFIKKPDRMKIDQDFSAFDHPFFFTYYYNGGDVWVNVNLAVRQHPRYTAMLTKQMRRIDGVAYFLAQCDTLFTAETQPADTLFGPRDVVRVGAVDLGDTIMLDIDRSSGLLVRAVENGGKQQVIYQDYRECDGVKMPFKVTVYQDGTKTAEYTWDSIRFDVDIDDTVFEEMRPEKK